MAVLDATTADSSKDKAGTLNEVITQAQDGDANTARRSSTEQARSLPVPPRRFFAGLQARANCTHIVMDFVVTNSIPCDSCGQRAGLGWLYACMQDQYSEAVVCNQMEILNQLQDKEQLLSRVEELQTCGMSRSILDQIKQGNVFDPFQIEVLKNQKINMMQVMDKQLSREHEPWNLPGSEAIEIITGMQAPSTDDGLHRNVTLRAGARTARAATSKLVQKLCHFRKRSSVIPKCGFKCCHACRPYLRDRAYLSLGAAVNNEIGPERFHGKRGGSGSPFPCPESGSAAGVHARWLKPSAKFVDSSATNGTSNGKPVSRRSPSYSDKLRDRAMPPGLYQTTRSPSAECRAREAADTSHRQGEQSNGLLRRITRNISPWKPFRSKSQVSLPQMISNSSPRHSKSYHVLSSPGIDDEEYPESADLGLQTSWHSKANDSAVHSEASRGRQLTRGRYYALLSASNLSGGQSSSRSDASSGTASSDEVPVSGGVSLTEEAVTTHVPDIITQV